MRLGGVGADDEDGVGASRGRPIELVIAPLPNDWASPATVEAWQSRAQWSTLLVPHDRAHELLEEVVLLVGAARRGEAGDGVGAVLVALMARSLLGDEVERLVPGRRHELAVAADERAA